MTDALLWGLRGIEGFIFVVGALIAVFSLRAYRRTREGSLAYLGAGFALVTVAAAVAGVVYELLTHDLLAAWSLSAALNGAGFAVILYSIVRPLANEAPPGGPEPPETPPP